MPKTTRLFVIGGAEKKGRKARLLRFFFDLCGGSQGRITVITCASQVPLKTGEKYQKIFFRMGAASVKILPVLSREEANSIEAVELIRKSTGIFISGGNQLKVAATIGGTQLEAALAKQYRKGVPTGGTSAGASIMSSVMVAGGKPFTYSRRKSIRLSAGLGLIQDVIIDQHFRERDRIYRLAAAVMSNPRNLGMGIDEDTALYIENGTQATVMGDGTVSVLDGLALEYSSYAEGHAGKPISIFGLTMHVLTDGDGFDFATRTPIRNGGIGEEIGIPATEAAQ
jgi:cyanophycinase